MSTFDRAEHCRRIAHMGGQATASRYDHWHFATIGRAGKESTIKRHGVGYWRGITKAKGWGRPRQLCFDTDLFVVSGERTSQ